MAETVLAGGLQPTKGSARHQIVIHVDDNILHPDTEEEAAGGEGAGGGRCHLQDGPALSAETVRRLACDAGIVYMLHGPDGAPVNVSRRSPSITTALNRALQARDNGCRFPGCTHHRFVDAHHIDHRAQRGETTLTNLLQLCRAHHRLVHEGGYRIQTHPDGTTTFHRPDGTPVQNPAPAPVTPGDAYIRTTNTERGIHPTPDTPIPDWHGERPDYAYIIANLFYAAEYRQHVSAGTPTTT